MARDPEFSRGNPRSHAPGVLADVGEVESRTRRYGERPHGWGAYEANYDLASAVARRVDSSTMQRGQISDAHDHRGKGPRDYRRSDERQRELACEALTEDPRIDATNIDVQVRNGEITLSGFVESRRTKFLVEELLANTLGTEITNRLQIRAPQETPAARKLARDWLVD